MAFDANVIQEIKSRLDLAEIVRRYVELRPVSGRFMAVCPFHHETKPSMSVSPDQGFFYCFGCQASGDVIDFYARINGLEFPEALEQLAAEAGVELRSQGDPKAAAQAQAARSAKRRALAMHELAAAWFQAMLKAGPGKPAREYLARRGVSAELVQRFGLGFAPDGWQGLSEHLHAKGYTPQEAHDAGLLARSDNGRIYDRFRNRLIFPIQDVAGRTIAFGGRIIAEGEPKYLNSSDSPVYKKGEHLFGLAQARTQIARSRRALLTEGYLDVIALHQFGYGDAVGVLGTALTPEQVKRLAGFCTRVELVFDGDPPGRKAARRSAEMILHAGLTCRVVLLPDGQDVDDVLRSAGKEAFDGMLAGSQEGLAFCMSELRAGESAREIVDWAVGFLKGLRDPSWRAYFLPRLVQGLGLAEDMLRRALGDAPGRGRAPQPEPVRESRGNGSAPAAGNGSRKGLAQDKQLLAFAIRHPEFRGDLAGRGADEVLATTWARELWEQVMAAAENGLPATLDDGQKSFWARCLVEDDTSGIPVREHMAEICRFVDQEVLKLRRANLLAALREAEVRGDVEEAARLAAALHALNAQCHGSLDEQS